MKSLYLATVLILTTTTTTTTTSSITLATELNGKFKERKERVMQRLDKKITQFTAFKSCVSSANDKEALKVCRESHKAQLKSLQENNKSKMKERRRSRSKSN